MTHVLLRISTWKLIIDVINETKANYIPILQYIYTCTMQTKDIIECQGPRALHMTLEMQVLSWKMHSCIVLTLRIN
jgi:hypothetical protein